MQIEIKKSAFKDLEKIDKKERVRILEAIEKLKDFPDVSNIKKLKKFNPTHRLRVGNYRVLFDLTETSIIVGRVLHRKDAY